MTLRGKDYCNCDHARYLREAIEEALGEVAAFRELDPARLDPIIEILEDSLKTDHEACMDLWGDLKEARSRGTK